MGIPFNLVTLASKTIRVPGFIIQVPRVPLNTGLPLISGVQPRDIEYCSVDGEAIQGHSRQIPGSWVVGIKIKDRGPAGLEIKVRTEQGAFPFQTSGTAT